MRARGWKEQIFLGVLGLVLGLGLFLAFWNAGPRDLRTDLPPCFETGTPFHHRHRPNCREIVRTPQGPVEFQTNEDGLRELPRDLVLSLPNRVLVMGDSFVEGRWLREDQAFSSRLRDRTRSRYFINGALGASGTLLQASRLDSLLATYQPEELWLSVNDTDVLDDRLACALAEKRELDPREWKYSARDFEADPLERFLLGLTRGWRLEEKLRTYFYEKRWASLVKEADPETCEPCLGLRSLQATAAARKVPLRALLLDLGHRGEGVLPVRDSGAVEALEGCLRELRIPYFALRLDDLTPVEANKYLWAGEAHWNPLGAEHWAQAVEEAGPVL